MARNDMCLGRKSKTVLLQKQCEHIHDCYSLRPAGLPPLGWHGMKKVLGYIVTTHLTFCPNQRASKPQKRVRDTPVSLLRLLYWQFITHTYHSSCPQDCKLSVFVFFIKGGSPEHISCLIYLCICRKVAGWMNGWMDGWVDGWMDKPDYQRHIIFINLTS